MKTCKAWLLATVFAILLMPAAAQAAGGVSGTVTAVGGGALEGVSVCAHDQLFSEYCATTGTGGEYEIAIPTAGKYRVKFEAATTTSIAGSPTQRTKAKPSSSASAAT